MATKKKILIAEDEKPLANALKYKLENAGYAITIASDGEQALEAIHNTTFDLVLLDLVMPKLDGFGVLEACKKENIQTPIVVLSNLGQESDVKTAKDLGAKDFFIKSDTQLMDIKKKIVKYFS